MKSRRDLKMRARTAMQGNMGKLILACIVTWVLAFAGSMITMALFPGTGTLDMALSQIFSFIFSLILSVVSAGFSFMFLNTARGRQSSIGDLFYFFSHHPDRVITATFIMALIQVAADIPLNIFSYTTSPGAALEEQAQWMGTYGMLMLLAVVLNMLLTLPFAMVYYILADDSQMGGIRALKESARMMKGKIGRYFLLQLSFVPLLILSVFTLYLALLWVIPYMEMTVVMFYRDILGELDPPLDVEALPYQGYGNYDDYNSEA